MTLPGTFTAFRNRPMQLIMRVAGIDLTGVSMFFAARKYPDAPFDPVLALDPTAQVGGVGIRFVRVEYDDDGLPVTIYEGIASKAMMSALPYPGEPGDDVSLAIDLKVTGLPIGDGFASLETTLFSGSLIIKGSVNG